MAKTYEELLAGATQIKNNELPESNTHSLVGGQLLDMVEKNKDDKDKSDKKFTELENKTNKINHISEGALLSKTFSVENGDNTTRSESIYLKKGHEYIINISSTFVGKTWILLDNETLINQQIDNFSYSFKAIETKRYDLKLYTVSVTSIGNLNIEISEKIHNSLSNLNAENVDYSNYELVYSKDFTIPVTEFGYTNFNLLMSPNRSYIAVFENISLDKIRSAVRLDNDSTILFNLTPLGTDGIVYKLQHSDNKRFVLRYKNSVEASLKINIYQEIVQSNIDANILPLLKESEEEIVNTQLSIQAVELSNKSINCNISNGDNYKIVLQSDDFINTGIIINGVTHKIGFVGNYTFIGNANESISSIKVLNYDVEKETSLNVTISRYIVVEDYVSTSLTERNIFNKKRLIKNIGVNIIDISSPISISDTTTEYQESDKKVLGYTAYSFKPNNASSQIKFNVNRLIKKGESLSVFLFGNIEAMNTYKLQILYNDSKYFDDRIGYETYNIRYGWNVIKQTFSEDTYVNTLVYWVVKGGSDNADIVLYAGPLMLNFSYKPFVMFSFDAGYSSTNNIVSIAKKYNITGSISFISANSENYSDEKKKLNYEALANGWDGAVYAKGINDEDGFGELGRDNATYFSEKYQECGYGLLTTWHSRGNGLRDDYMPLFKNNGIKVIRGGGVGLITYYDDESCTIPNITMGDNFDNTKNYIDKAVANKCGICLFTHGVYSANNPSYDPSLHATIEVYEGVLSYLKELQEKGDITIITPKELYELLTDEHFGSTHRQEQNINNRLNILIG